MWSGITRVRCYKYSTGVPRNVPFMWKRLFSKLPEDTTFYYKLVAAVYGNLGP